MNMCRMIKEVTDPSFATYGRVLDMDLKEFLTVMDARSSTEMDRVVYEPSVESLEQLRLYRILQDEIYGGMPVEFGHCSGWNKQLNALEYHRSSEIDLAATDLVLMLGREQDINRKALTYDTSKVECFRVPRGTAVELYADTLHYAPCSIGKAEFRMGVVLPRGTNLELEHEVGSIGENRLLQARNKWLLVHPENNQGDTVWYGLQGQNLRIE